MNLGPPSSIIAASAEGMQRGVSEMWASKLAALIGGEAYQTGVNIWLVLFRRPDGRFIVTENDGAEPYRSAEHFERYYDKDWPEPECFYWSE